ncbi:MAG: adenylate/guanylate cyclase domain-containing protein, partial [Rhizobiaceae bacterium]|nr:adenylate/guanylate cyclase domain-containing protein [Rhizobiaceae bacterium]
DRSESDARMHFRIGLNLGDVIAEGNDIYGDGVNIAARLQACATAGGIVISNTVYDQVRNKVAVGFDFLGQLEVKNIDGGVASYAVRIGSTPTDKAPGRKVQKDTGKPTKIVAEFVEDNRRKYVVLAIFAVALVLVNLLNWHGELWSVWPVLVAAVVAGFLWVRSNRKIDRGLGVLAVIGLGLIGINLLSWSGTPWAIWPVLGIAVLGAIRWATRRRNKV